MTDKEIEVFARALIIGEGWVDDDPPPESIAFPKLRRVIDFVQQSEVNAALVSLMRAGTVAVSVDDAGELIFSLTEPEDMKGGEA